MKIVYIASSIIPSRTANSIHVMKMCQAFAKNGHEVTLVIPGGRSGIETDVTDNYEFYGVDPCFEIERIPWFGVKGRTYVFGFSAARQALSLGPDLVYGRHAPGCYFAAAHGIPVCYELHAPPADKGRMYEWFFKRLVQHRRFITAVFITQALASHCLRSFPALRNMHIVAPDGADQISDDTEVIDSGLPDRFAVGYAGSLYRGKGAEIVSQLAPRCPWADFHIVGGSEQELLEWREHYKNRENLFFHGFVNPKDVQKYLLGFDVLLLPNQHRVMAHGAPVGGTNERDIGQWTSPLKLFEYMASGKPIVCSNVPVLLEVAKDEANAIVCDPEDIDSWVNAIIRLRDNPELGQRVGANAKEEFLSCYTWSERARRIVLSAEKGLRNWKRP